MEAWPLSDILGSCLLVAAPVAGPLLAWRVSTLTRRVSEGLGRGIFGGCAAIAVAFAVLSTGRGAAGLEGLAEIIVCGLSFVAVVVGSVVAAVVAGTSAAVHAQQRAGGG